MIKRLKKKSWSKVTLYHATSSQILLNIINDGQIMPGGYIDQTSNGAYLGADSSGQQDGVYLCNDSELYLYYLGAVVKSHFDKSKPNIPVTLKVQVDTDALIPDWDDWSGQDADKESNVPMWKQCLDQIGQVVHVGPISMSSIEAIYFAENELIEVGTQLESIMSESDAEKFIKNNLPFGQELKLNEAVNALQYLYSLIEQKASQHTASSKNRLKKKAWDSKTLYHATSSQVLLECNDMGALLPSGYTDITSNGLSGVDAPSGEQNGIYLGIDEDTLLPYYNGAIQKTIFDDNFPNLATVIKVTVQTDALAPDYDDLPIVFGIEDYRDFKDLKQQLNKQLFDHSDAPLWLQSLSEIGQVVHYGPISTDSIVGVKFLPQPIFKGKLVEQFRDESIIWRSITFNSWLSFEEAIEQLKTCYDKLKEKEQEELSQTAFSRLKRQIRSKRK